MGRVYLDEVQFETAAYTTNGPDVASPSTPTVFKCGNKAITNGFVFKITNSLTVQADSDAVDPSIEGVLFEYYSYIDAAWHLIGTDYETTNSTYVMSWNTSDIASASPVKLRAYSQDASGNKSGFLTFTGSVINVANIGDNLFKKPDQKILTPNNDGVNDILQFTGLENGFEINIFSVKGVLIRKITDVTYWDGKDKDNRVVNNGIYIYQVKSSGKKLEGTILIVK
jgi:gliding motility-associated-like protein